MNSIFYSQDLYSNTTCSTMNTGLDQYLNNSYMFDFSFNNMMDQVFNKLQDNTQSYPITPPLFNDVLIQQDQQLYLNQPSTLLNNVPMVPPLNQTISMIDIDFVDKFIAEHEAVLNSPSTTNFQEKKEMNWSHWHFNTKDKSPEMLSEGLSSSTSTTSSSSVLLSPEMLNDSNKKVTKGRRGRKSNITKSTVIKKTKSKIVEGALYVCQHENCGRSFTRPYNLTSHMRTHTTERPFACSTCGRRFARQHDRNRHEKLHLGIRPYACDFCHKSFARMDALNRHLRMENGCTATVIL